LKEVVEIEERGEGTAKKQASAAGRADGAGNRTDDVVVDREKRKTTEKLKRRRRRTKML